MAITLFDMFSAVYSRPVRLSTLGENGVTPFHFANAVRRSCISGLPRRSQFDTYPPKASVSHLINSLKGVSSRIIRKKNYPGIRKKLWGGALWSPSYFAGNCGGAPIAVIRQYVFPRKRERGQSLLLSLGEGWDEGWRE